MVSGDVIYTNNTHTHIKLRIRDVFCAAQRCETSALNVEYVSAAQTPHVSLPAAPTMVECLPAAHFTPALLPLPLYSCSRAAAINAEITFRVRVLPTGAGRALPHVAHI